RETRARRTGLSSRPWRARSCSRHRSRACVRTASNAGARRKLSAGAAPEGANDPDQQTGADKPKNQVADPSAKHDSENTEDGAGDRGPNDAKHDIQEQAHIPLKKLSTKPASDPADDNGRDPTNSSIRHGAPPQNEVQPCTSFVQSTRTVPLPNEVDQHE